ncbi:MAG: hypothetical protein R3284_01965 [Rubricoccaceae bacterium]|nr:hypothetical protein [Rubricoccaceae bacterium]
MGSPVFRRLRIPALLYAAACVALWPWPLLGILHVEASAVIATLGFFVAGLSSLRLFSESVDLRSLLTSQLVLLGIPWLMLTVSLLWRANCGYGLGLILFATFTIPSVMLAVCLAYAISGFSFKWPKTLFVVIGLALILVPVAVDLKSHPQLYTYNPVFGGVLGPIYDEELSVRFGLFAFRGLTILFAVWLVLFGRWLRLRKRDDMLKERSRTVQLGAIVSLGIALAFFYAPQLGIKTTARSIESVLSESVATEHFVIHFAPEALTEEEITWIVDEHRYRYAQLVGQLDVEVDETIHTYLYPDEETRGRLIGSRTTSVTPVWLETPQIHMVQDLFTAETFGHELVHVFGREFGMPLIHASPSVGLVEGLAVALEPPGGLPSAAEQVAATLSLNADSLGRFQEGLADAVASSMNPWGFWTGRGAVSYAVSGSFVSYLIEEHGVSSLKHAYRTGNFRDAFGTDLDQLAERWEQNLSTLEPTATAKEWAAWRFSQPSLFEQRCPHHIPSTIKLTRKAWAADEIGDGATAHTLYRDAYLADSTNTFALIGWATRSFTEGDSTTQAISLLRERVRRSESSDDVFSDVRLVLRLAELEKLAGDTTRARQLFGLAAQRQPAFQTFDRTNIDLRSQLTTDALRVVLSPGPAASRAAALDSLGFQDEVAYFFAAGNWSAAGFPSRALRSMQRYGEMADPGSQTMQRFVYAYQTILADRSADYETVARVAPIALQHAREENDTGMIRLLEDLLVKSRWFLSRPPAER